MLSVEALDDVLKSFYLEVVSSQINCGASPLYDKIEKSSVNVNGKNAIVPIYYGINGSLLSTNDDGATLPESCPTMRATLEVPLRNVYGVIDVTDKALRLTKDNVDGVIDVNSLLVLGKMVPSKSEGRRAIEQGGVSIDGEKVTDVRATVTEAQLKDGVLIKRGKKSFMKFILK